MCKKMPFSDTNFEHSPYSGRGKPLPHLPTLGRFAPSLWPMLTNPGCTTVTGIAKGTRGHAPAPLIGVNNFSKKGGVGDWYIVTSHNEPPNNAIQCARNVVSYTNFQKNLPTVGGGKPLIPTPSPLSVTSLPLLWPPLTNPGCTTVTGIAKMHKGPCSPLIGVKEIF